MNFTAFFILGILVAMIVRHLLKTAAFRRFLLRRRRLRCIVRYTPKTPPSA